jgi:hypothetical protein
MELTELLSLSFGKPAASRDLQHLFEYFSIAVPCTVRIPDWYSLRGTIANEKAIIEFTMCSPNAGPVIGLAFSRRYDPLGMWTKHEKTLLKDLHKAYRKKYAPGGNRTLTISLEG